MAAGRRSSEGEPADELELTIRSFVRQPREDGAVAVTIETNRGAIRTIYHPAKDGADPAGAVWVGGAGGGLDGPARGLYPEACRRLAPLGVAGLRLDYRRPNDLPECVLDTLAGVQFLALEGIARVALIGHSFGGAVVISAGTVSDLVAAVVPMSTQTYGTALADQVAPRPMLLIHGADDEILPDACSRDVYRRAREPKEMKLYPGARHGLDEAREEILDQLVTWIEEKLGPGR